MMIMMRGFQNILFKGSRGYSGYHDYHDDGFGEKYFIILTAAYTIQAKITFHHD